VNAEERRAGFVRLGFVVGALVVTSLLFAGGFVVAGASATRALGAGTGLVGVVLVGVAVGAFMKANPMRRPPIEQGRLQLSAVDSRRDAERLALGAFTLGIAFLLIALTLG
jgi:hypothetical protein